MAPDIDSLLDRDGQAANPKTPAQEIFSETLLLSFVAAVVAMAATRHADSSLLAALISGALLVGAWTAHALLGERTAGPKRHPLLGTAAGASFGATLAALG